MAIKDITRFLHQPTKNYFAVRMQQGRTLLDSDFNEGARLEEDQRRRALIDLIGPTGAPDHGFSVGRPLPPGSSLPPQTSGLRAGDLLPARSIRLNGTPTNVHMVSIRAGTVYVGGLRLELSEPEHFAFQRGYLQLSGNDVPSLEREASPSPYSPRSPRSPEFPEFRNFYYLNGWEQPVTSAEDEEFLERALGGPDTSIRMHRVRRVEVVGNLDSRFDSTEEAWLEVVRRLESNNATFDRATSELKSKARLQLVFESPELNPCKPCTPDPDPRYLGHENQALRIMLSGADTFVWAFDNAAPLYRVRVTGLGSRSTGKVTVEMLTPPRDDDHLPRKNRVIEILPFGALLEGGAGERPSDPHYQKLAAEVGVFTRVNEDYKPNEDGRGGTFTIDTSVGLAALRQLVHVWDSSHPDALRLNFGSDDERFFYMRMWHEAPDADDVQIPIQNDPLGPALGDTGVVPVFHQPGRAGDFWVATLRTDAREQVVPFDLLTQSGGVAPHGPHHFYAPLALVHGDNLRVLSVLDARSRMRKATDRGCSTLTVGDPEAGTIGDFSSIQEAIDALPLEGGVVSIRPGLYVEQLDLSGRTGIVLEGCGATSVVRTPTGAPADGLIRVENATDITIRSLTLEVGAHVGVLGLTARGLSLIDLHVIGGDIESEGGFDPGGGPGPALIDVRTSQVVTLRGLKLEPSPRTAVLLEQVTEVDVFECRGTGSPENEQLPADAMLVFQNCLFVRVRDLTLESVVSQVGVAVRFSVYVDLARLSVEAHGHPEGGQALSAVDINQCSSVRLRESALTMDDSQSEHAALVVRGDDVVIQQNRIEALDAFDGSTSLGPRAWGGIQLRGFSHRVDIRENHIVGGLGHGITLGSVRWTPANPSATQQRREGAGKLQIQDTAAGPVVTGNISGSFPAEGTTYTARDEGELVDIALVENRIEGMATNGISVLTVLGLPGGISLDDDDLIDLQRSLIARNTIVGNLRRPAPSITLRTDVLPLAGTKLNNVSARQDVALPILPFGGIVLSAVTGGVEIQGNVIADNGTNATAPYTGIFILNGDAIVIANNRINGNGGRARIESPPVPGVRAGIAVMLAGTGLAPGNFAETFDPVDFSSEIEELFDAPLNALDGNDAALQVLNNTVQHPEGRALHAVATGPVIIDGNFLSSQGYHGYDTPSTSPLAVIDREAVGDVVFVEDLGKPWEGSSTIAGPLLVEPVFARTYLGPSVPGSPRNFIGFGGSILFNNNQVLYDWDVTRFPGAPTPLSYFATALLSLDHVAMSKNHFSVRVNDAGTLAYGSPLTGIPNQSNVPLRPLLADVFVGGATISALNNRFAETQSSAKVSLMTLAELMNVTAFNQSSYPILPFLSNGFPGPFLLTNSNQTLFYPENFPTVEAFNLKPFLWIMRDR